MIHNKVQKYIPFITLVLAFSSSCQTTGSKQHQHTNALINESSPYLLQHAHNPVNWYPWGEEALKKAQDEDKPIIISVGYAACHWCHVMEHESFEDTTVARIMNEHFVAIKVDREERPDVDDIYMTACQMSSGRGCGWPLNALALPNGQPVWAGTYFPKEEWLEILNNFVNAYATEKDKMQSYAESLTEGLNRIGTFTPLDGPAEYQQEMLGSLAERFTNNIDFKQGGRTGAPKFPVPNGYEFLLQYHHLSGDEKALEAVDVTLENIALGGIYDHLGGGFARYSTDAEWKVPHFEKMLYDNAQLVSLYSHAFQKTANPLYEKVVRETLTFVERELSDKNGGFYSSLDADSEGEEGKFYVWKKTEIDSILADEPLAELFCEYFEVQKHGNWESTNILYRRKTAEELADKHNISTEELAEKITTASNKLFEARSARTRPGLDDKILTSWNALMITGYLDAYQAFKEEQYLQRAFEGADFILNNQIQKDGRLNRNFKDGKSSINAFLDDYALCIEAFLQLYATTFDEKWLDKAQLLTDYTLQHFNDTENAMLYYTSDQDPALIARKKEIEDNVISASNSVMARNLLHLGTYLYNNTYIERSKNMLNLLITPLESTEQPHFYANWCRLYAELAYPLYEVAIVGPDFESLLQELQATYHPNVLLLGGAEEGNMELLKDKLQEGETFIYVCQNKVCQLPVREAAAAIQQLSP
jgi:uncharacterized protein YyaL (SSP411 family)